MRDVYKENGIGGEVRHGVTSGVSRETGLKKHVTPHLPCEYQSGQLRMPAVAQRLPSYVCDVTCAWVSSSARSEVWRCRDSRFQQRPILSLSWAIVFEA